MMRGGESLKGVRLRGDEKIASTKGLDSRRGAWGKGGDGEGG